jgi:hypothetical protein
VSDRKLVERVAREFIDRHGSDALLIIREYAEISDGIQDELSCKAWRDIADAVERLLCRTNRDDLALAAN